MYLHEFLIKLIQSDSIDINTIKTLVLDPKTKPELFECLIRNYKLYETLLQIRDDMDICVQPRDCSLSADNLFFFLQKCWFLWPTLNGPFSELRKSLEPCFGYVLGLVGGKRFLMKKSDTPSLGVGEAGRIQEEVDFLTKSPISATWTGFSLILMFWDLQNAPVDF